MDVYNYENVSGEILTIGVYTIPIGGEIVSNGYEIVELEGAVGPKLRKSKNGVQQFDYVQYNKNTGGISSSLSKVEFLRIRRDESGVAQALQVDGVEWVTAAFPTSDEGTSRSITAADDGYLLRCTAEITLTWPAGLSPNPTVIVLPPEGGAVTIACSGGATLNGGTGALDRYRAVNQAGVAVVAAGSDAYGVSGT